MSDKKRVFLLDGLAIAYRSHFAFIRRPLTNTRGENTSAVFAFTNTVIKLRDQVKPDFWALAWDSDLPTRRHVSYPEYKAHRPPMPEDLVRQLPQIDPLARALGLPVHRGARHRGRRRDGDARRSARSPMAWTSCW